MLFQNLIFLCSCTYCFNISFSFFITNYTHRLNFSIQNDDDHDWICAWYLVHLKIYEFENCTVCHKWYTKMIMSRVNQVDIISEHWKIFDQALSAGDLSAFAINNASTLSLYYVELTYSFINGLYRTIISHCKFDSIT